MKKFLMSLITVAALNTSHAVVTFSGTAIGSNATGAGIVSSTTVGVLLNLDSGTDWSQLSNLAPGTSFSTNGTTLTIGTSNFSIFGRNTASGLGSMPGTSSNFAYVGGMTQGDEFGVLLFPNSAAVSNPTGGTSLSLWRSANWTLPLDGSGTSTFGTAFTTIVGSGATSTVSFSVVPEPSTYALMALGGLALFFIARRRKAQQA